jgi:hypothetical protein
MRDSVRARASASSRIFAAAFARSGTCVFIPLLSGLAGPG